MDPRRVRREVRDFIEKFRAMDPGGSLFAGLVRAGVDSGLLHAFREAGAPRKSEGDRPDFRSTVRTSHQLLDMGGQVAGGGALAEIFRRSTSKDVDFFFNDEVQYGKAFFMAFDDPKIDVCFYLDKPYDLFDLGVSRCSFGKHGTDVDALCSEAMETGVSEVLMDRVVAPEKTVARMLKYHEKFGIRYRPEQALLLCAKGGISDRALSRLLGVLTH